MAFGKKKTQLVIPPPNKARAIVNIGGEFLVTHKFSQKSRDEILGRQQGTARNKRGARNPEAEYEAARYIDAKGRDCIPAAAFRRSMIDAAAFVDGLAKTQIRGLVFVISDIRGADGRWLVPLKFERRFMHEDVIRLPNGHADMRYRPAYENWSVELTIEYDPDILTAEQVHHLVQRAGCSIGVGEGRAQKGGDWGSFDILDVVRKRAAKPTRSKKAPSNGARAELQA